MDFDRTLKMINEEFEEEKADPELVEHVKLQIEDSLKKELGPEVKEELSEMLKKIDHIKITPLSHKDLIKMLENVERINNMKLPSYETINFEL